MKISQLVSFRKRDQRVLQDFSNRLIAQVLVVRLKNSWVRPNHVTFVSLIVGLSAAFLVTTDLPSWIPGLLLFFSLVLDSADGQLARAQNRMSKIGGLFDKCSDRVKESLLIIAITFTLASQTPTTMAYLLGIIMVFLLNFMYFLLEILKGYSVNGINDLLPRNIFLRNLISFGYGERLIYASVLIGINQLYALLVLYLVGLSFHITLNISSFLIHQKSGK